MSVSSVSSSTSAAAAVVKKPEQAEASQGNNEVRKAADNGNRNPDVKPPATVNSQGQVIGNRINTIA